MSTELNRRSIRVRITLPDTSVSVGGLFSFDVFQHVTGVSVDDLLSSLLFAPVEREVMPVRCVTYPIELPEGQGAEVPVGTWGTLGFFNRQGRLVLTVPRMIWPGVQSAFGPAVESAREVGSPPSVQATINVTPGMKRRVQISTFGVLGIETV